MHTLDPTRTLPRSVATTNIVHVHDITRTLPLGTEQIQILRGISFSIFKGTWVAITGPSGSGKSTVLGILAGLDTPTTGQVVVDGVDITHLDEGRLARFRNEKIGIVFQNYNLIPTLTALENVEVPLFVSRNATGGTARAKEMLDLVGLSDRLHHQPHQLSGGQQQRVAIARALVNHPAILIGDEPTGNLDSKTGDSILHLFTDLRRSLGLTVIIATHDPAIAEQADQTLHIVDGCVVEAGQ